MLKDVRFGRTRLLALLAVAALGLAACGSDDDADSSGSASGADGSGRSAEERAIATTYDTYIDSIDDERWKDACAAFSRAYAKSYPKLIGLADTCTGTVEAEYGQLKTVGHPRVVDVRVSSPSKGIVFIKTRTDGNTTPLTVVKEGGSWKLAGLDDSANEYGTSNDPYAKK